MGESNKREELSFKQIVSALSSPIKIWLSVAGSFTGLSAIGVITSLVQLVEKLEKTNISITITKGWTTAIGVSLLCVFIGIIAIAFVSLVALVKHKIGANDIITSQKESLKKLQGVTEKLAEVLDESVVSGSILNSDAITELESKGCCGARIVVMTSKFQLDKGKLLNIIINNICRGARYEYLVPSGGSYSRNFSVVYNNWWKKFVEQLSIQAKDKNKRYISNPDYSDDYKKLIAEYSKNPQDSTKAMKYFCNHVKKYSISNEYSLVTIIMYQQEAEPSNKWEVIMKLPTSSNDGDYYAFKIPAVEEQEKQSLIQKVDDLCVPSREEILVLDKI